MNTREAYKQHHGKVVESTGPFKHLMAVALNPLTHHTDGIIRCITSRKGDVTVSGYVDRSEIYKIRVENPEKMRLTDRLVLKNEDAIVQSLSTLGNHQLDFIGLEDPDLFFDPSSELLHLYFTMPFLMSNGSYREALIHLGHAVGKSLDTLEMTLPVLSADMDDHTHPGAKEVSITPPNSKGIRLNLVESKIVEKDFTYSTVRIAVAADMGRDWQFGKTVFHPKECGIPWISGHASPGPLFPKSFIDIGGTKLVGIINGREANRREGTKIKYGIFSVGLFIYDYEEGSIDWVSPEPLIRDTDATTITFASQFIDAGPCEGILYAHVDDSFVRAYTLYAEGIKRLLPTK